MIVRCIATRIIIICCISIKVTGVFICTTRKLNLITDSIAIAVAAAVIAGAQVDGVATAVAVGIVVGIRRAGIGVIAGAIAIGIAVDNLDNTQQLSAGAVAAGVELQVLVEIDAGMGRCGISPGVEALKLTQRVDGLPGLKLVGIMGSVPGPKGGDDPSEHESKTKANIQVILDSKEAMEQGGLSIEVVSVGGAHCYAQAIQMAGVTEVRAGRYPLMDHRLKSFLPELNPAAKILASVISHPIDGMAVLDAGHKATAPDQGRPVLDGIDGAEATRFSAEHGIVELEGDAQSKLNPGDKAWLVPYELGASVNQYDYFRAAKNGKLEGFWPISARGRLA